MPISGPSSTGGVRMSALGSQAQSTTDDRGGPGANVRRSAIARALEQIATAAAALRQAFAAFRQATQPIYTGSFAVGAPIAVHLHGVAPRTMHDVAVVPGTAEDLTLFGWLADPGAAAYDTPLADIPEYATVRAGTLTVNGESFEVDPSAMTLRDLIARLNALADCSASLDDQSGAVTIIGRRPSSPLAISDASHVLDAMRISAGSYMPAVTVPTLLAAETLSGSAGDAAHVTAVAAAAVRDLNRALDTLGPADADEPWGDPVAAALLAAVDALRLQGIGGLAVAGEGRSARLALDPGVFAASVSHPVLDTGDGRDLIRRAGDRSASWSAASGERTSGVGGHQPAPPSSGFVIAHRIRTQMSELLTAASTRKPSSGEEPLTNEAEAGALLERPLPGAAPGAPPSPLASALLPLDGGDLPTS